jgi:hypothetical protein
VNLFEKIMRKIRVRNVALRLLNKTRARMYKKLSEFHLYMLNDLK